MKHSKQKGNLGFSATLKELHKLGYNVFTEIGDNSRIDMIVEVESKLIKLQVKYVTETNGKVTLKLQKSGPNGYRYTYTTLDIDIFSVYIPSIDKVIFVPAKLALKNTKAFNIRFIESKNKQNKFVNFINEFENLDEILKNFNGV
jgi:hypothetical protein